MDFSHILNNWGSIVSGAVVWSVLGYAARTIPQPQNPYGVWLVNIVQFVFANADKFQKNQTPKE